MINIIMIISIILIMTSMTMILEKNYPTSKSCSEDKKFNMCIYYNSETNMCMDILLVDGYGTRII